MMCSPAMQRKIESGEAIDISNHPKIGEDYVITQTYEDDRDYCIAVQNQWVWSIGKCRTHGTILASRTTKFSDHPGFDCIWLR